MRNPVNNADVSFGCSKMIVNRDILTYAALFMVAKFYTLIFHS